MNNNNEACLRTKSGDAILLRGITLEGDCRGLLFEAAVVQRYTNPTDRNMEVIYNFPLPHGAVLLGVDVVLGGKPLSGSVVARKAAEVQYEDFLRIKFPEGLDFQQPGQYDTKKKADAKKKKAEERETRKMAEA